MVLGFVGFYMIINIELTSYLIFAMKDMIIAAQKNAHLGYK